MISTERITPHFYAEPAILSLINNNKNGLTVLRLTPATSSAVLFLAPSNESQLLTYVMRGEPENVKRLLDEQQQQNPIHFWRIIFCEVSGTELHNGRKWRAITPLAYTLFAGDFTNDAKNQATYLFNILVSYIPYEYRHLVLEAKDSVIEHGTEHGIPLTCTRHLVKDGYQHYVNNYPNFGWDERASSWDNVIGGLQKSLTVFELQFLCDPVSWKPVPDFKRLAAPQRVPRLDNGDELFKIIPTLGVSCALHHWWGDVTNKLPRARQLAGARENGMVLLKFYRDKQYQLHSTELDDIILGMQDIEIKQTSNCVLC